MVITKYRLACCCWFVWAMLAWFFFKQRVPRKLNKTNIITGIMSCRASGRLVCEWLKGNNCTQKYYDPIRTGFIVVFSCGLLFVSLLLLR